MSTYMDIDVLYIETRFSEIFTFIKHKTLLRKQLLRSSVTR